MDPLNRLGATTAPGPVISRPVARGAGGFTLGGPSGSGAAAPASAASLVGLLALQEAGGDAVQDREARKRGHELLIELGLLQRDLLSGAPDPAQLARLARLAETAPEAADPGLRDLIAAITTRARIEIARYT